MQLPYNDFGTWIRARFGAKIQKISVNAGFTCPNRDGSLGVGGCVFCNNATFNPTYCDSNNTIRKQLEDGKSFFNRKYKDMKYLAYFQAYTNTYASLDKLKSIYEEALNVEDVVGIVIGTRPDCVDSNLLDYFECLNRQTFLCVEYGIESANNSTLKRINRGHDFECSSRAVAETAQRGIMTGGHVIIGLPGEDKEENLRQAETISGMQLDILKLHQLQIIKGTKLEQEYSKKPFHLYNVDEYVCLMAEYVSRLREDLIIDRFVSQSPKELLVAPYWGIKNHEFTDKLVNYMKTHNITQGCKVTKKV